MQNTIRQAVLFALVMLLLGPLAGQLAAGMMLSDGGPGGVIFSASSAPIPALLKAVLIVLLATIAAALGSWLRGPRHGLVAAGLTLAWAAWATPSVDELFRRTRDGSVLVGLLADAVLLSILTLAGVLIALRLSRAVPHRTHDLNTSAKAMAMEVLKPASFMPLAAMVIAGSLAGMVIARSPLDGQVFAAAVAAGLAGAAVARILAFPISLGPLLVGAGLIAIVAPAWGIVAAGTGEVAVGKAIAGTLPGLAWLSPWAALGGLLVGVPLGASWAEEVAAKQQHKAAHAKAAKDDGIRVKRAAP